MSGIRKIGPPVQRTAPGRQHPFRPRSGAAALGSESQVAVRFLTALHKAAAYYTTYPTAYPGAQMHQCTTVRVISDAANASRTRKPLA